MIVLSEEWVPAEGCIVCQQPHKCFWKMRKSNGYGYVDWEKIIFCTYTKKVYEYNGSPPTRFLELEEKWAINNFLTWVLSSLYE